MLTAPMVPLALRSGGGSDGSAPCCGMSGCPVAMALAESTHHSSRGQKTARAGVWGHELNFTATIRDPPTPQPELFSLYEEPGGAWQGSAAHRGPVRRCRAGVPGSRRSCAADGRPAGGVARSFRRPRSRAGYRSAQDVDAFPLPSHGSLRAADSGTVVEFPNVVSLIDVIRHPVEQTVGGRIGGLPGFLPGQSYSPFCGADR